ncbi:hypothetical protein [Tistlia consotensis]|uniref:hypothetical protein n=1 Tax=Tistlia consotensis TaxID=1321365 RepID=UPI0015C60994|nr:hypothetical protein [Tistlia consotensis]
MKFAAGTKRMLSLALSNSALPSARVPMSVQPEPSLYCHTPCVEVAALPTIATPAKLSAELPPVTASVASENLPPNSAVTVEPAELLLSSATVSAASPVAVGASFTAVTEVPIATVAEE